MPVKYGQGYTDKKTQSTMMRFLKLSDKYAGSKRLGKAQPKTQLNKDSKPKNDFFGNPRTLRATKGSPVGSEENERVSNKPLSLNKRNESQKTDYKPRAKKATGRPTNTSKVNRRYK